MLPTLLFSATLMTPAADPPADTAKADEAIHKYLAAEVKRLSERFMNGAKTKAEWEVKRPKLKEQFLDMLGLWPLPEKTPLKATVTGTLVKGDVTIDKMHFQSKPGLYVTANLYRPTHHPTNKEGQLRRLPAILYVCGHSNRGRDGNKTAFQDHGMWFASNGYICLLIDTLQLGEIPGVHHGTYGRPYNHLKAYGIKDKDKLETRWWWHCLGYTPAGVECWNGVRAIDYLVSRPDVDPERVGVTGISGGGAATFWIAAADERVKVAVPVSGMSDLESYVKNKIINHHCDCMLMINTYGWEWTTIAALIAPRPMLFCNSDQDTIFPMDANRRIADRLRTLYKMYDKPELFDDYVSQGGHDYRPDIRLAVFKWINKYLKNDIGPVKDADFKPIAGKDLRVFAEDSDVPKDAINGKIDETFVPAGHLEPPKAEDFQEWKAKLLKDLREQSFRSLPQNVPAATYVKGGEFHTVVVLSTEANIQVVSVDNSSMADNEKMPRVIVLNSGDLTTGPAFPAWAKEIIPADRSPTLCLWTRGLHGYTRWTDKSPPNTVERSLALIGQSVEAGRVHDVIAMCRGDKDDPLHGRRVSVVGRRQAGV